MPLDSKTNFALVTVASYYSSTDTQIVVSDASRLPTPPYNAVWWDDQNYPGKPWADPNREIVRVTAHNGNTLTLANSGGVRVAQEGTSASSKNTAAGIYRLAAGATAKDFSDIDAMGIDVGSAYAWVTEYGALGDGSTDDYQAIDDALDDGVTYLVFPAGTYKIGSDLSVGASVTLVLLPGATLAPTTGKTVTVGGSLIAHSETLNGGAGTVTLSPAGVHYLGSDLVLRGQRITHGTAAPSTGSWTVGDFCLNSAPSAGEAFGWRCTSTGSPGTWEAVGGTTFSKIQSDEIAVDSTGKKTVEITHGMDPAPSAADIILSAYISSGYNNSDVPGIRGPFVEVVQSGYIRVMLYVEDAGYAGTKMRVNAWVKL